MENSNMPSYNCICIILYRSRTFEIEHYEEADGSPTKEKAFLKVFTHKWIFKEFLKSISLYFQMNSAFMMHVKDTWYLSPENDCEHDFHAVSVLPFNKYSR